MRPRLTLGLLAGTGVLLAGCGASVPDGAIEAAAFECPLGEEGCDVNEPIGPGGEFVISSGSGAEEFSYSVEDGLAVQGEITVEYTNNGSGPHNVEFIGAADGSEVVEAPAGESDSGTVGLFPGEWTFFCNIPGHRAAGMEATVTVVATEEEAEELEAEGFDPDEDDEVVG